MTGKGARSRIVYFGHTTTKAVWYYLSNRAPSTKTDRVFLTRSSEPMTVDRLQKTLRDLGERAGVTHCHPHRFRHTAARLLLRNGVDAFTVQHILGHSSISTTSLYVRMEREDIEKAYERADPVDRWNLK